MEAKLLWMLVCTWLFTIWYFLFFYYSSIFHSPLARVQQELMISIKLFLLEVGPFEYM